MHTYIHAYMHTYIHAYLHTCIPTSIHIYIHVYISPSQTHLAHHRGWQLLRVAHQYHLPHPGETEGQDRLCLHQLRGFIDDRQIERPAGSHCGFARRRDRAEYDAGVPDALLSYRLFR